MRLVKKKLARIPLEPCPPVEKEDANKVLAVSAKLVNYEHKKLLAATFYRIENARPYCRLFCGPESYITQCCDTGKWTSRSLEKIAAPHTGQSGIDEWNAQAADKQSERAIRAFTKDCYHSRPVGRLIWKQFQIRQSRGRAARQGREKTKWEIMREAFEARPPLPGDLEEKILECALPDSRYLFYRREAVRNPLTGCRETEYIGYCTHCRAAHPLGFVPRHNKAERCPGCGSAVTVKAWNISRSRLIDRCHCVVFSPAEGGNVYVRLLEAVRDYTGAPERVHTELTEMEVFYFTPGKAYGYTRYAWAVGNRYPTDEWSLKRKIAESVHDYFIYPHPRDILDGTCLEHCRLDDYIRSWRKAGGYVDLIAYLGLYVRRPNVENLLGAGLGKAVREAVYGGVRGIVDWQGRRPRDMLGLTSPEVKRAAELGLGVSEIAIYKRHRSFGLTLEGDDLQILRMLKNQAWRDPDKILRELGERKGLRYLRYQYRRHYRERGMSAVWMEWGDYRSDARRLGYDMTREDTLFPPDLPKAHDRVAALIRELERIEMEKRQAAEAAEWEMQYQALQCLCFEYGDLRIRPARSRAELLREGEKLCHCVAGYAERVCAGKTHIFFIRRRDAPDEPYYTMNISPKGEFLQCHGYKNDLGRTRPPEMLAFEQKWLSEIVKPWAKKREAKQRKAARREKKADVA